MKTPCFHTELCKFLRNISTNIYGLGERTDLKHGGVFSLFIFNRITISWLYLLNGFRFIFLLRDCENSIHIFEPPCNLSFITSTNWLFQQNETWNLTDKTFQSLKAPYKLYTNSISVPIRLNDYKYSAVWSWNPAVIRAVCEQK